MISAVGKSEDSSKNIKTPHFKQNGDKESSSFFTYAATGLAIAAASVGIALFAKYKNII